MKHFILVLITIILIGILSGCTTNEKQAIADEYGTITEDNVFDKIKLSELDDIVAENDVVFVYFGAKECSACVTVVPYIDAFAKSANIETVYYVEFYYGSDLAAEWYENGTYDYEGTPLVVTFADGEFVRSNFTNRSETSSYLNEIILMFDEFGARS